MKSTDVATYLHLPKVRLLFDLRLQAPRDGDATAGADEGIGRRRRWRRALCLLADELDAARFHADVGRQGVAALRGRRRGRSICRGRLLVAEQRLRIEHRVDLPHQEGQQ